MEEQIHQSQHQSWGSFPCSPCDCRDYEGRWKITADCLKWLADLLWEWPQVLFWPIQRGGQMHLVSYIGLIRLINQSHPHPPIRFYPGYFYEMGYRRSAKYLWSLTDGTLTYTAARSANSTQHSTAQQYWSMMVMEGGFLSFKKKAAYIRMLLKYPSTLQEQNTSFCKTSRY